MRAIKHLSVGFVTNFWLRVHKHGDGCWYWLGARDPNGYGRLGIGNETFLAHRVAWAITNGDPGEHHLLHQCDNPPCVNPEHLFQGTNSDNVDDRIAKGREPRGEKRAHSKLYPADVFAMRRLRQAGFSYDELGRNFGVAHTTARRVCLGITWNHLNAA